MSPPPLVSTIIPVHNRADLLARAIRSVIGQSMSAWEAIVIDDASERPIAPVVEGFGDPRLRTIRLDRNAGPAAARNTGMAEARGPYVAFLDSDDEWRPDKLAAQLNAMRQGPRVLVSGALLADGRRDRALPARAKTPGERIASYLYVANQFAQASCMFAPTSLARQVGFDSGLRQYEDHLFLLQAEAAGAEIEVSNHPLILHHVDPRPDRLGRRDDQQRAASFLRAASHLLSPNERIAFQLRCMSAEMSARDAIRLLLSAITTRGVPKDAAFKTLTRSLIGPAAYAALRDASRQAQRFMRWST